MRFFSVERWHRDLTVPTKNIFQINDNKKNYIISGKIFNASKLIDDLIFKDTKNKNIFDKDYILKID